MSRRAPAVSRRRCRKEAADCEVGVREVAPDRWALPTVTIDVWFVMRAIPGEHRGGFRAWAADGPARRAIQEWDRLFGRYRGAAEETWQRAR